MKAGTSTVRTDAGAGVRCRTLANGLRVVHAPRPGSGVVSLQFWLGVGSALEEPWPGSGISHFLEHLVFKGTARRTAREINCAAEAMGGQLNAFTSYDRTVYHIDVPAEAAGEAFRLLTDFVFHPVFPESDFETEREVVLREMAMVRDDPGEYLFHEVLGEGMGAHPARFPIIGEEARFRALDREAIRSFHTRYYGAANAILVVSGDVPEGGFWHEMEESLGALPPGGPPPKAVPVPPTPSGCTVHRRGPWEAARGLVIFSLPLRDGRDYEMGEWVLRSLAGSDSSRLRRLLRGEHDCVHHLDGSYFSVGGRALCCFEFQAEPDRLEEAEARLRAELGRLAVEGLPQADLEKARRGVLFDRLREHQTVEGWADSLGERALLFGTAEAPVDLSASEDLYTPDRWREFVAEWLAPERALCGQLVGSGAEEGA